MIKIKVFLGGTCSGYNWRSKLVPLLSCDYYNPIVKNWSEKDRLREVQERETSDYVLYTITRGIKGVYSIAEVVDDSNKRPEKTIYCDLYKNCNYENLDMTAKEKEMAHSLGAVEKLLESNGVLVFHDLNSVATYLNSKI